VGGRTTQVAYAQKSGEGTKNQGEKARDVSGGGGAGERLHSKIRTPKHECGLREREILREGELKGEGKRRKQGVQKDLQRRAGPRTSDVQRNRSEKNECY